MLNRRVLTSVVVAVAAAITTPSFAQHRGTGATPAAGANAGATQGTFTTSDAIPWKPLNPKQPGLQMFVVWGNPNEGASEIVQKFPAGWDSGWHWHTAAYEGVVVQGKWTHTFKGAAPETGGPGSTYSQPARQVHDDKCEEGAECIIVAYFHGKRDFMPVNMKAQTVTPAAGAKGGATQDNFTTSDAIPWKPVDPAAVTEAAKHPGLLIFAVWGNPNTGASEILQEFPAGMDSGWHWHTAAYEGVVVQGKFTHTFEGAAPETGGPGSVWSQPARQIHDDKCEEGGDCIVVVYFHGKLDFMPVNMKAQ
jgi:Domain of unknown function (DUF4437)